MRHAFLVIAHKDPNLLCRILSRLEVENHLFYINIDSKSTEFDDVIIEKMKSQISGIRCINRDVVNHGGFSQIACTLKLMRAAMRDHCDYIHLISGQCYPCVSNNKFDEFFNNKSESFIYIDSDDEIIQGREEKYRQRICRLWFFDFNKHNTIVEKICIRVLNKLCSYLPQKFYDMNSVWGGWNWFSLHFDLCEFLIEYLEQNPTYAKDYRYSYCGDELFFNSIIMKNISKLNVEFHNSLRYVDWHPVRPYKFLPLTLNEQDFDAIISSGMFFCRKVDSVESAMLLNMIDEHLL